MSHPIANILMQPWAILPGLYHAAVAAYVQRIESGKEAATPEAVVQRDRAKVRSYEVVDGTAIIPVEGVLTKRPMMLNLCEVSTGTANIRAMLREAKEDPGVTDIVMYFDTPGGSVEGTPALAADIRDVAKVKPVDAFIDGLCASAGMWLATQARRIVASSETDTTGSVGVVATHINQSKRDEMDGIVVTEITSGPYKRAYSSHRPLDELGAEVLTEHVNSLYSVMIAEVAAGRGTDPEDADARWGGGREFLAKDALALGLIDGIQEFGEFLSTRRDSGDFKEVAMTDTKDTATAEVPGGEVVAGVDVNQSAVADERARILGIMDAALPGQEALARQQVAAGATVEEATAAFLAAHRKTIVEDAPEPTGDAADVSDDPLRAAWDASPARRNFYGGDFEEYKRANDALDKATREGRATKLTKGRG